MKRRGDWEAALAAYLERVRDKPYAYGQHDCLLFVAGSIKALTGKDLARGHRGKYKSATGAKRYLKKLGFSSPEKMLDSLLPAKPVGFAQRGDIVLADNNPGVCVGGEAVFAGEDGLILKPRAEWSKAWGVGA